MHLTRLIAPLLFLSIHLVCSLQAPNAFASSADMPPDPKNNDSRICERTARQASIETGVPLAVLLAITLTETGRKRDGKLSPWPWTVNMEGAGKWFKSQKQALDYVSVNHKRGARSFDVGCFQLNFKWHGSAFSSIEDMFDPNRNALYAANLLKSLFAETGSWETAAGAYHSRTPKYANKYKKRFRQILAGFTGEDLKEMSRVLAEASRQNLYPLLQVRGQGVQHRGSLFQASDAEPAVLLRRSAGALF